MLFIKNDAIIVNTEKDVNDPRKPCFECIIIDAKYGKLLILMRV